MICSIIWKSDYDRASVTFLKCSDERIRREESSECGLNYGTRIRCFIARGESRIRRRRGPQLWEALPKKRGLLESNARWKGGGTRNIHSQLRKSRLLLQASLKPNILVVAIWSHHGLQPNIKSPLMFFRVTFAFGL